jgi:small-conductance mechanosensitive channel
MTLFYLLTSLCLIMCLGLYLLWFSSKRTVKAQKDQLAQLTQQQLHLQSQLKQVQESLHEMRSGSIGMGARLKELITEVQQICDRQEDIVNLDPASRMYGKAAKLVSDGASVEELMEECELPRAEAELLFNMRKR